MMVIIKHGWLALLGAGTWRNGVVAAREGAAFGQEHGTPWKHYGLDDDVVDDHGDGGDDGDVDYNHGGGDVEHGSDGKKESCI